MHVVDIVLLVFFLGSMFVGYKTGFISALLTWVGLFVSLMMIARYGPIVQAGIMIRFGLGPLFSAMIAYILIAVLIMVLFALLKILLNYLTKLIQLSFLNKIFGAVFGFFSMIVVLVIFVLLIGFVPFKESFYNYLTSSMIIQETIRVKDLVRNDIKDLVPPELFNR